MTMVMRSRYHAELARIERDAAPRPARTSGATGCQRSGVCCWRRPCDLHPGDDVPRLAAFLGLTPERLFADLLVVDAGVHGLALRPRRGEQAGGRYLSDEATFDIDTSCVFLRADGCSVHAAKPTGGAQWGCWMSAAEQAALPQPAWSREDLVALGWDGDDG